ncbi:MAG: hypothetical protein EOO19_07415, partial [Chryseobacterium sp.]
MSSNGINYNEFLKYVHHPFEERISFGDLEQLLELSEDYNKDSVHSLGKAMSLDRLVFSGTKRDKSALVFDQEFFGGINVWIADNHKGKSTIFKVIKLALTGTDTIKKDIRPWMDEVILGFKIGKISYTTYIDRRGRDRGGLYRMPIDQFLLVKSNNKLDSLDNDVEFLFRSNKDLEEKMEEFFFDQLSYYTLKYTSKSGLKDEFRLNTNALSWTTYFKSIYLESSNYDFLFFREEDYGAQGKKIFEMILGLPLTYPINRLKLQLEKTLEAIGRTKLTGQLDTGMSSKERKDLQKEHKQILEELTQTNVSTLTFSDKEFLDEYDKLQAIVTERRNQIRVVQERYQGEKFKISPLEEEIYNLNNDVKKIEAELVRLGKNEINMELYRQTESFFSNLEIKTCPHCEIAVSEEKKQKEHDTHKCSLCGETPTEQKIEDSELELKTKKIQDEITSHSAKLKNVSADLTEKNLLLNDLNQKISSAYEKLVSVPSIDRENSRMIELEQKIDEVAKARQSQRQLMETRERLIREEAILRFRLEEKTEVVPITQKSTLEKLNLDREILEFALLSLGKKRVQLNADILSKLQNLILNEVNSFGLVSIENIEIDDKFNLLLTQNGVKVEFGDLEPGEKLRIKLAFYLSLIQLDIDYSLGRHPRFLIFDSPGSEEMVPKHLHGLSEMFKTINDRLKGELQIFVGSALREFDGITDKKKTVIKG